MIKKFKTKGMHCSNYEALIEKAYYPSKTVKVN